MIKITKTEHAGFCFGVERAIDRCNTELDNCRGAEQSSELFRKSPSIYFVAFIMFFRYALGMSQSNCGSFCDVENFGLVPSELDQPKRRRPKILWAEIKLATQCNERARKLTPTQLDEAHPYTMG